MQLPSKLIEDAVDQMASLPGIGKRTALRLVLSLLKKDSKDVRRFAESFIKLKEDICECSICHNLSDSPTCSICSNPSRDESLVCVVEDIRDIMAIEATHQFRGRYHVLGGIISPIDGIGPADLHITSLIDRLKSGEIKEILLALSTTMEGETTAFYLYRKIADFDLKVTSIARGIGHGDELQYADELTLGKSIVNRVPYENSLNRS
ncbi:MAG: recombination protein RecR [Flavobacteriales bacterium]|nr:recombination protein RecR [Flavobacteriales bacterium]